MRFLEALLLIVKTKDKKQFDKYLSLVYTNLNCKSNGESRYFILL